MSLSASCKSRLSLHAQKDQSVNGCNGCCDAGDAPEDGDRSALPPPPVTPPPDADVDVSAGAAEGVEPEPADETALLATLWSPCVWDWDCFRFEQLSLEPAFSAAGEDAFE